MKIGTQGPRSKKKGSDSQTTSPKNQQPTPHNLPSVWVKSTARSQGRTSRLFCHHLHSICCCTSCIVFVHVFVCALSTTLMLLSVLCGTFLTSLHSVSLPTCETRHCSHHQPHQSPAHTSIITIIIIIITNFISA